MRKLPHDYRNRVYAGWLGKCAGVRFGAPVETWTYQEILDCFGELNDYLPLPEGKIFKPDDDTSFPMILIRAMEDFGPDPSLAQIGETWLNYLADQRGTLWWGGYGAAGEHTAYLNLKSGIPPQLSGSAALNGLAMAEGIGGQIFNDIWGLVFPAEPKRAADCAEKFSSVSHEGNGVYGARYLAALVSLAFGISDTRALVEKGLDFIPEESEYARMARAMLGHFAENRADWRKAYRFVAENFGYDKYQSGIPIISNAAIIVMALLYGGGDFSKSLRIANMGGWDTDCNVGNVGTIMGVAVGIEGIPESWRTPMRDELVLASVVGSRNFMDIPSCADLIADMGERAAGKPRPNPRPRCHFLYPGSTHGFRIGADQGKVIDLRHSFGNGPMGLNVAVKKLGKKSKASWYLKTSCGEGELSANYYGASFSPKLYPGQTIEARIFLPESAPDSLVAGIFCSDRNAKAKIQGQGQPLLRGRSADLSYTIPRMANAHISEAGIVLRNTGQELWDGSLVMESFTWGGEPDYESDFSLERQEAGAISQWTFHRGFWRLEKGSYIGSGAEINETYTGDIDWEDYSFSSRLVPVLGGHHFILTRVQGARRSYAFGLVPQGRVGLFKKEGDRYRELSSCGFEWRAGEEYELSMRVKGNALCAAVDGKLLCSVADGSDPYLKGQVGLSNFGGCNTIFRSIDISGAGGAEAV